MPFWRKIAPDTPACINRIGPAGLGQRMKLQHAAPRQCLRPGAIIQIQQPRRHGLIHAIHTPLLRHRDAAGFVLVHDPFKARHARGCNLIIQRHAGLWQIVEKHLEPVVEKRQPMLDPLGFTPGTDRLVERVIGGLAKFDTVILPKPGNGGLVQDNLRDRRQFHTIQRFSGALAGRIKTAGAI